MCVCVCGHFDVLSVEFCVWVSEWVIYRISFRKIFLRHVQSMSLWNCKHPWRFSKHSSFIAFDRKLNINRFVSLEIRFYHIKWYIHTVNSILYTFNTNYNRNDKHLIAHHHNNYTHTHTQTIIPVKFDAQLINSMQFIWIYKKNTLNL